MDQRTRLVKTPNRSLDDFIQSSVYTLTYIVAALLPLSALLFLYLNNLQSHYYIDEKFHIPQALQFCDGNFFEWDSKITTLPGLYLFSALILAPFDLCSQTTLRLLNLIITYLNFILVWKLVNKLNSKFDPEKSDNLSKYVSFLTTWNIAFFPVLFFHFFLYYTDTFSVTLILMMLSCHIYGENKLAAFIGACSILVRQTNVIWVAFMGIETGLSVIESVTKKPKLVDTTNPLPCLQALYGLFKANARQGIGPFWKFLNLFLKPLFPYILVLLTFLTFVIYNEGIVVGDRSAHKPTVHVTQLFYFVIFVLGFAWPHLLPFLQSLKLSHKSLSILTLSTFCIMCIIHSNTLVHPYILADNRHYSFYIWKNFMSRYGLFKYMLAPIYVIAVFTIFKSLSHVRLFSVISYFTCVCLVIVPQLLLEPRYFIIPYIFFRLNQRQPKKWQIVLETLTNLIFNTAQFFLFCSKTFYWKDEEFPQRIAW